MTLEVIWSDKAQDSFGEIIRQIETNWSEKEVSKFIKKTDRVIQSISKHPYMYQTTQLENVRKAVVAKQCSIIYETRLSHIEILFFWDNRQDPII